MVLGTMDVPTIVDIITDDPILVENKRRFFDLLELPPAEFGDVQRESIRQGGSESYNFFSTCLSKWITHQGDNAKLQELVAKLQSQNFRRTAEQISTCNYNQRSLGLPIGAFIWFDVPEDVLNFTGRTAELKSLHDSILQSNNGNRIVITTVRGLGGVGKTSLTIRYAWEYHQFFGNVVWINSENPSSTKDSFTRLTKELNVDTSFLQTFKETVSSVYKYFSSKRVLFIFDNAEAEDENLSQVLPSSTSPYTKRPYVLLTSRNGQWSERYQVMWLDVFTPGESIGFIKNYLNLQTEVELQLAKELSELLEGLPLAVRQATAYIKTQEKYTTSMEQRMRYYRTQFDQKAKHFLSWQKTDGDKFKITTYSTWNITFDKIKKNPLALRIMQIISLLAPDNIQIELLEHLSSSQTPLWENLAFWKFKERGVVVNSISIAESVNLLLLYSLLTKNNAGQFSVHRLLQTVVREQLNKARLRKRLKDCMKILQGQGGVMFGASSSDMLSWDSLVKTQVHCHSVLAHAQNVIPRKDDHFIQFYQFFMELQGGYINSELEKGETLLGKGLYSESLEVFKNLLQSTRKYMIERKGTELLIILKIGKLLNILERYAEALSLYDDVINNQDTVNSSYTLKQFLQNRCYTFRLLGKPNTMPKRLASYFEIINQAEYHEKLLAVEILDIISIFSFGFREERLAEFYKKDEFEAIVNLLINVQLVKANINNTHRIIYIDLVAHSWLKLFTSYEQKKSTIKKSLLLLKSYPSFEHSVWIWIEALQFDEIVLEFSQLGLEICRLHHNNRVPEILIQTIHVLKGEFEVKCDEILDFITKGISLNDLDLTVLLSSLLWEMLGNHISFKLSAISKVKLYEICLRLVDSFTQPQLQSEMQSILAENIYCILFFCDEVQIDDLNIKFRLSENVEPDALQLIPLVVLGRLDDAFNHFSSNARPFKSDDQMIRSNFFNFPYVSCLLAGASISTLQVRQLTIQYLLECCVKVFNHPQNSLKTNLFLPVWERDLPFPNSIPGLALFCSTFQSRQESLPLQEGHSERILQRVELILEEYYTFEMMNDCVDYFSHLKYPGFEDTVKECLEFVEERRVKWRLRKTYR